MSAVSDFIDRNFPRYVAELQEWLRQPSVSSDGTGMFQMSQLVKARLERAGGVAHVFELPDGYPAVYGEFTSTTQQTLLFYNHYDTQPPGALTDWQFPPFSGEVFEGRLFARGAADNKGCLLSRIHAIEAVAGASGVLPLNVKFLIEGEEEIGSPNLGRFVSSNEALLAADACIWEYAAKDSQGRPSATLGNKGMCYVELVAKAAKTDFHSMYANLIPNAAWRLVWALSTLKDEKERILIGEFYDDVSDLSRDEVEFLKRMPLDEKGLMEEAGISKFVLSVTGMEAKHSLFGLPTCTICGLGSGQTGEGALTILPSAAKAKIDFRLVVDQHPEDILGKLRAHLVSYGFDDIEIRPLKMRAPAKTPVDHPFVQLVADAAYRAYGQPLVIQPTSPGSGPRAVFSEWTAMPIVGLGVGHIGSAIHAPNENIVLEDYRDGIKHIAAIIELLGGCG